MFIRWILLFTLEISSWLLAHASFVETTSNNIFEEFTKACPSDGIPVCGTRGNDYFLLPNKCWLDEVNGDDILLGLFGTVRKSPIKNCIHDCKLMCSPAYEPVCVINIHTNERKLFNSMCQATEYACRTEIDFQQIHPSECEQTAQMQQNKEFVKVQEEKEVLPNSLKALGKRSKLYKKIPIPCTGLFKPVCGVYRGVKSTFKNECFLNAENVKFDRDWRIINYGICDEDYSNLRRSSENKPFKGHSIRKRSYGTSSNFISFQSMEPFRSDVDTSSNDLFRHMTHIPQIFETKFIHRDSSKRNLKNEIANSIIQKIISLPAPTLDATSHEHIMQRNMARNRQMDINNIKPIQYQGHNSHYNYNSPNDKENEIYPEISPVLERNEILPPISPVLERRDYYSSAPTTLQRSAGFHPLPPGMNLTPHHNENTIDDENYQNNLYYQSYQNNFHTTPEPMTKLETTEEASTYTTPATTSATTSATTRAIPKVDHFFIISRFTTPKYSQNIEEKTSKPYYSCKFGIEPICGVLANGTVKTFGNICEMMTTNSFLKNTWVKLHSGICEKCETSCPRAFKPLCVQRNGLNYTMVNECYYNMGICLDKGSKWKKISDGECMSYTLNQNFSKAGFQFTSKYSNSPTTSPKIFHTTPAIDTTTVASATTQQPKRTIRKRHRNISKRPRPGLSAKQRDVLESFIMNLAKRRAM